MSSTMEPEKQNTTDIAEENSRDPEKKKGPDNYTSIGISLGLCLGAAFGLLIGNMAMGAGIGLCIGIAIGAIIKKKNQ